MRRYKMLLGLVVIIGSQMLTSAQKKPAREERMPAPQSQEQNKQVARRVFEDLFTAGRYGEINQVFDPSCRVHFGGRSVPLEEAVAEGKGWRSAAPDLVMTADQVSVNGDTVTVVWTARGTHTGQGHGLKPTGRRIQMRSRSEFLIKNGKIVEARNEEYRPELFRQLGVSKTAAFMFFTTERLLSALADVLPARVYASLLQ
jgi:predicted ester cyclase